MLALLAAQPMAREQAPRRPRRRLRPSPSWGAGSRRTAPANTTAPRRACAPPRRRICAARTGRCSCSARASSTTATTARAREQLREAGARARPPGADGAVPDRRLPLDGRRPRQGRGQLRAPGQDRDGAHRRRRAGAVSRRRASRRARQGSRPQQFLAIARDFPAHPLADEALRRIGAARRAPADDDARRPDRRRRHRRAARRRPRSRRPAEARGVAVEGPALGRGARRAGPAARDAGARAGRRARLPDRHDEVPHAPRLPDGGRAAAGRGRRTCRATRRRPRNSTARAHYRASIATTRRSPATAR